MKFEFYNELLNSLCARYFSFKETLQYARCFWEALRKQNHPEHRLPLTAVQNIKNRQAENLDPQNKTARVEIFQAKFERCERFF